MGGGSGSDTHRRWLMGIAAAPPILRIPAYASVMRCPEILWDSYYWLGLPENMYLRSDVVRITSAV
jgi:hypothetical protein